MTVIQFESNFGLIGSNLDQNQKPVSITPIPSTPPTHLLSIACLISACFAWFSDMLRAITHPTHQSNPVHPCIHPIHSTHPFPVNYTSDQQMLCLILFFHTCLGDKLVISMKWPTYHQQITYQVVCGQFNRNCPKATV